MTEIDFYVLADAAARRRETLACRIAEKAHGLGHTVFVHMPDSAAARAMDELLWTFNEEAFLPHALAGASDGSPILIGGGEEPSQPAYLLINLADTVPAFFSRFERVAEIVNEEPAVRDAGRERFRFYRDRGYSLRTHKL